MIYIVGGLPGAGKSIYSKKLADKVNGIVFSMDVWMSDLYWVEKKPGEDVEWALQRMQRCEKRMISTCAQLSERNMSSILDIGFVNLVYRQKAYKKLDSLGLDYEIHFLDVAKEIRWQRVEKRNSQKGATFSFEVTREMFDFMEDHFDEITHKEVNKKIVKIKN